MTSTDYTVSTMVGQNGNYKKVPFKSLLRPFDGCVKIRNNWWIVVDDHVLFYEGVYPKCHPSREILSTLANILFPDAKVVKFFELYINKIPKHNVNDSLEITKPKKRSN